MDQEKAKAAIKMCEDVLIPHMFPEDAFRSALSYKPKKGDLFIVTYPKCGTTWMHHIVLLILRHGKIFNDDPLDVFLGCPFMDIAGAEVVDYMTRPGAIKTHLPYHKVPQSKDAKYIYVCRNPKDCLVSFYYHVKTMSNSGYEDLSFEELFDYFITGNVAYGDYFDHVMGWYEHRDDPNVHIVTYEALKKDVRGEILKLAKFIDEEYEKALLNDSKILDDVIKYSSFEYMKKDTNESLLKFMNGEMVPAEDKKLPPKVLEAFKVFETNDDEKPKGNTSLQIVRKGIVGDWKNHFSPDQLRRMEERVAEKTANSGVMSLWD